MKATNHVLLTRFNLPSPGVQSLIRAKEGWLRERVALFERYCRPSVLAQECRNFTWMIYVDPASPDWLQARMRAYGEHAFVHPIYRESVSEAELIDDISEIIGRRDEYLMTTNLDNDDAIAVDFMARLQSVPETPGPVAIYVTNGLIRSNDSIYRHRYPRNAFNTVRAEWSKARTCWSEWHTDFGKSMPVVELAGSPGWMQVVHGANVSNRVKGHRTSPDPLRPQFGRLLDGVSAPRRRDAARDLLVARPGRLIKESGRALAKRGVLATLGKDGIDKVQFLLRSRSR